MSKNKTKVHTIEEHLKTLNTNLINKQKLTKDEVETVAELHQTREKLFLSMEKMKDQAELRESVSVLEEIEFAMQKAWKFTQDRNFHTWWNQAPHCSCPTLDNRDFYGTGNRIINGSCVLHGVVKK